LTNKPLSETEVQTATVFISAAESFCALLEAHAQYRAGAFIRAVQEALAVLYSAALRLRMVEPSTTDDAPETLTTDQESELSRALSETMSPYHIHWFVFDPVAQVPDEPVAGHLPSDLSEIYRDVRNSCSSWVSSDPGTYRDALWEMHFGFMSHWGRHAVTALAAMHSLLHDTHVEALEDA